MTRQRKNFTAAVILERRKHCGDRCEGLDGKPCGAVITRGKYHADHHDPDAMTGQPTFDNCRILCLPCHAEKTRADQERISRAKRVEAKHEAPRRPAPEMYDRRPIPSKPMPQSREAAEKKAKRQSKPGLPPRLMRGFVSATEYGKEDTSCRTP